MLKMHSHASHDRIERMVYLATEIGIGETLCTVMDRGRRNDLTEHGVIIVYSDDGESVLTAYLASVDRAYAMCQNCFGENFTAPNAWFNHIDKVNRKHAKVIRQLNLYYGYKD